MHRSIRSKSTLLKYTTLLTLLLIALSGCGSAEPSTPPQTHKVEIPSWYLNPPKDSATFLYGVAIGKNRDDAIKLALTDMIAKLGIKIESTFESNVKVQYGYASKSITNQVKSSIDTIKINNYDVVEAERLSYNKFAILLKTDKLKLAKSLKEDVERKHTALQTTLSASKNSNILSRYKTSEHVSEAAKTLLPDVLIIQELEPSYSGEAHLSFIQESYRQFLNIKNSLGFYVKGDKHSAQFVNAFENYLTRHGYHILAHKNKNTVLIKIETTLNNANAASIKIITYNVAINAMNNGEKIGGKNMVIKLRKSSNMTTLNKNAAIQFTKELESKDIYTLLQIQ